MADDNSELLAVMGDVLRAIDRQTEENKRQITELREEFVSAFNSFATATVDGFIRVEGKIEAVKQEVAGVKQEVAELRTDVDGLKQEVAKLRTDVDGLKQEVVEVKHELTEVKQTVQRIDQRLEKVETNRSVTEDVVRRLTILENIVLNKAS